MVAQPTTPFRHWFLITGGATGLMIAPRLREQIEGKRHEPVKVYYIDYDGQPLAEARRHEFETIQLQFQGDFPEQQIRDVLEELSVKDKSWKDLYLVDGPRNNPRVLRPVTMANLDNLKRALDAEVTDLAEALVPEAVILLVYGACGPTSSTSGLVAANAVKEWSQQWHQKYGQLRVTVYAVEAIPLDYSQGAGVNSNAVTGYFSRLSRAELMKDKDKQLADHLFIANGADNSPAGPKDFTLEQFSSHLSAGLGFLFTGEVEERGAGGDVTVRMMDCAEEIQGLPSQVNVAFLTVGYPEVPDMKEVSGAIRSVETDKCWLKQKNEKLHRIVEDHGFRSDPLIAWEQLWNWTVVPAWLAAVYAVVVLGWIVLVYMLVQGLVEYPTDLAAEIGWGLVTVGAILYGYLRHRRKDEVKNQAVRRLRAVRKKLEDAVRVSHGFPPLIRTGYSRRIDDLLERPLSEVVPKADKDRMRSLVQDWVRRVVPQNVKVAHLITIGVAANFDDFGFKNEDVVRMTKVTGGVGFTGPVTDIEMDSYVNYVLLYGPVGDQNMIGWETYEAAARNATDADKLRYNAFPEWRKRYSLD